MSSASHLLACRLCYFSPPPPSPNNNNVYPTVVLSTPFFTSPPCYSTPCYPTPCYPTRVVPLLPTHHVNPLLPNPCCALHPIPRQHPCYPPTMSHSNPITPLLPLPSTIIHAPIWCRGRSLSIGLRAACLPNGMPTASYSAYATTRSGRSSNTPTGQQLRAHPDFPIPADLQANIGPAAGIGKSRAAWVAFSAAFAVTMLDSIGESNRLAIADPVTDTLNLTPRVIITVMTLLHGTVTGAEVNLLRLPLKKKLSSLIDLPAQIVLFRGYLARLTTAGQAPLDLDAYRWFLASLSSFPVFH